MYMQQKATVAAQDMQKNCLGMRVGRLQRLVGREFDHALRPLGLSVPQLEILSALIIGDRPWRPGELASLLNMDRSTMSRNLNSMAAHGYVSTKQTTPAGRSQWVEVTKEGCCAVAQAHSAWRRVQRSVAARIGTEASHTLDTWLSGLTEQT